MFEERITAFLDFKWSTTIMLWYFSSRIVDNINMYRYHTIFYVTNIKWILNTVIKCEDILWRSKLCKKKEKVKRRRLMKPKQYKQKKQ